ncbi:hypothetical protein [Halohasta litchfieldiae]|nr:hypothetical protein [Halohasta litchfieldiae]
MPNELLTDGSRSVLDGTSAMNKISLLLLILVAVAVAGVVGMLVLAPEEMIENPPGRIILPFGRLL